MSDEVAAFMRAIIAEPWNDISRMMYANHIAENDEG